MVYQLHSETDICDSCMQIILMNIKEVYGKNWISHPKTNLIHWTRYIIIKTLDNNAAKFQPKKPLFSVYDYWSFQKKPSLYMTNWFQKTMKQNAWWVNKISTVNHTQAPPYCLYLLLHKLQISASKIFMNFLNRQDISKISKETISKKSTNINIHKH